MKKLKHFPTKDCVAAFVTAEAISNLRGELANTTNAAERAELRNKIADVESIASIIKAAPSLLGTLTNVLESHGRLQDQVSTAVFGEQITRANLGRDFKSLLKCLGACVESRHYADLAICDALK